MPKAARPAARCLLGSLEVGARRRRGGHQVERSSKRTGLGHLPTGVEATSEKRWRQGAQALPLVGGVAKHIGCAWLAYRACQAEGIRAFSRAMQGQQARGGVMWEGRLPLEH